MHPVSVDQRLNLWGLALITSPSFGFMLAHPARWFAFGFGSGLSPWVPGTVGTLAAWTIYRLGFGGLTEAMILGIVAGGFALGCWACDATGKALGVSDHGAMVWDEFIAFWLVLLFVPASLGWQFAAFVVFRFFDMVKPPPIRFVESRFKGGVGVMIDDIVAALMSLLVLAFLLKWQQ